jgi:hypothetical protein
MICFCFCLEFLLIVERLNHGRLTTVDAVDADRVVVGRRHRHWSDVDFVGLHEGIVVQGGRLRRLERFGSNEGAFKPTSKKFFSFWGVNECFVCQIIGSLRHCGTCRGEFC